MKDQKCLFRLQYMRKSAEEPFKYHKGRDMHNHGFVSREVTLTTPQNEIQIYQSLQRHFEA